MLQHEFGSRAGSDADPRSRASIRPALSLPLDPLLTSVVSLPCLPYAPRPPSPQPSGCLQVSTACRWPAKPRHTAHRRTTMAARLCPQHPQNVCMDILSHEFTGSGWHMWFSSRKCRLYKLGTQENLATEIKPIWGILEKWPRIRSAFSKLCLAFFLRKTPPYLNRIVLQLRYQACWKPLQVTATLFLEPNIQPSVRFRIFRSSFSKMPSPLDVSPLNSRPGQPKKKTFQ